MDFSSYILAIELHLVATHSRIIKWFDCEESLLNYRPEDDGWSINEILEHVALTSHYLLILIDKGAKKALRNIHNLDLENEKQVSDWDLDKLGKIGIHKSFPWDRPEHMEPSGNQSANEIKSTLVNQLRRCLNYLEDLRNGEGLLYKTTMTVNNLGKINVYEYLYFLSQHAERHICQMIENKQEFEMNEKNDN